MFASYKYLNPSTQADVLADIVAILTGETDVNSLSASCDKANSSIVSTVAAGWTLHDGSSGTNKKVIKAVYSDNPSAYKYVEVDLSVSTAIGLYTYETFDSGNHTGTNKCGSGNYQQRYATTQSNTVYIFSNSNYIVVYAGYNNDTTFGDSSYNGSYLLSEMTRIPAWNTVASGYPSFSLSHTGFNFYSSGYAGTHCIRVKTRTNTILTGVNANAYFLSIGAGSAYFTAYFPYEVSSLVYDDTGVAKPPFFSIYVGLPSTYTVPLGNITAISDIWFVPGNTVTVFDTVTVNAIPYYIIKCHSNNSYPKLAVRKQ